MAGRELAALRGHESAVGVVRFLPDGERVFTVGEDLTIRLWNVEAKEAAVYRGAPGKPPSLYWTKAGARFFLAMPDGSARIVDDKGTVITTLSMPKTALDWGVVAPTGRHVLAGSRSEPDVWLWDAGGTRLTDVRVYSHQAPWLRQIRRYGGTFDHHVAFWPEAERFLTHSPWKVSVWDFAGEEQFSVTSSIIQDTAFSPSGDRVLFSYASGQMHLMDRNGKMQAMWGGSPTGADMLAWTPSSSPASFSRQGDKVMAAPTGSVLHAWDLKGQELCTFRWRDTAFQFAMFDPQGKKVFAAMDDRCAYLWDLDSNPPVVFRGHDGIIRHALFSPSGDRVLTCADDKTARLWDLDGNQLCAFGGHARPVTSALFSPDGERLFTASQDGTIREFLLRTEDVVKLADERLTRGFTKEERSRYADLLGESDR